MQRRIFLLLLTIALVSCYKDSDYTTMEEVERPPSIKVDGYLYGTYRPEIEGASSASSMTVNGESQELMNGEIPLFQLLNAHKEGQFIEFFNGEDRLGAAQVPIIENRVNYYEFSTIPVFKKERLEENIDLNKDLIINLSDALYVTRNGEGYTGAVTSVASYCVDDKYNSQLISYAYGKDGRRKVVDISSSFYLGLEGTNGEKLALSSGEIKMEWVGDEAELYFYSEEKASWQWVSDMLGGTNSALVRDVGFFAIGGSQDAVRLSGEVEIEGVGVAGQRVLVRDKAGEREVLTTSEGDFLVFIASDGKSEIKLLGTGGKELSSSIYESTKGNEMIMSLPVEVASSEFIKSDFRVLSCDGEIQDFKEMRITYGSQGSDIYALGSHDVKWLPVREETFSISAGGGPEVSWGLDQNEIHYLTSCPDFTDGFSYIRIREDTKMYEAFREERSGMKSTLFSSNESFNLIVAASETGSLAMENVNVVIDDRDFGERGYLITCANAEQGCGIEVCEITHFRTAGDEWNRIYFKGRMWMQTIDPPQAGNFNVEGIILTKI